MITKSKLVELAQNNGTPLLIIDHEIIRNNLERFRKNLPRVRPFYAIKANPEPEIVKTLYHMDIGFDVDLVSS